MHRTHREELPACVGSGQSVWWLRTDGGAAGVFAAVDSRRCIDGGQLAVECSRRTVENSSGSENINMYPVLPLSRIQGYNRVMKQPNILLIMADQFRGDCLGAAGHPDVKTPFLDTLAARGTMFENAYSSCPSCIAARAAFHTGLSQEHHGRVGYEDGIPWRYEHTLAGELSKSGYYTQCTGKMHVHPLRNNLGFHNVDLHDGYLHAARYSRVPYGESQRQADDYFHWLRNECGIDADVTDTGLECNSWLTRPWIYPEKTHPTNWVTDRAIDFFRRRDREKPFFLMASYLKPHPPFDPPEYYLNLYLNKKLEPPVVGSWENTELLQSQGRIFDSKCGPVDAELIHQMQAGYYGCITHLDHQIGRLIQTLVEQELYDKTVIIFTADHGEELGDHHLFRKSRAYEGSSRIPLIISAPDSLLPGIRHNTVLSAVTELRDIMPTVLDIAGTECPGVDGSSLLPLVTGETVSIRNYLHGEHSYGSLSSHWIVTETDKYVWYTETGEEQYFVLETDPREQRNLIHGSEYAERIELLRKTLIGELAGRPEGFTDGNELIPGRPYPPTLPTCPGFLVKTE